LKKIIIKERKGDQGGRIIFLNMRGERGKTDTEVYEKKKRTEKRKRRGVRTKRRKRPGIFLFFLLIFNFHYTFMA